MKKLLFITGVIACVLLVSSFLISKKTDRDVSAVITASLEQAYFEGQREA